MSPRPTVSPPWTRGDRYALLATYLVAVALRLSMWLSPVYGDEAWHFYLAHHWGRDAPNLHPMDLETTEDLTALFWWRPLFEALLAPFAYVSFPAWRLAHLLITATLPLWAVAILRGRGVARRVAYPAGAAVAFLPQFVTWSVIVFPDGLMTTFFAAALWARQRGRTLWAAAGFIAACWTKEFAAVSVAALAAASLTRALRERRATLWPPRLDPDTFRLAAALALGLVPVGFYLLNGFRAPGWSPPGPLGPILDHALLLPWMAGALAVGLAWPRPRPHVLLALVYPGFLVVLHGPLQRGIEIWYYVLPTFLVLLALAVTCDEAMRRARTAPRPAHAKALRAVAAITVALLLADLSLPSNAAKTLAFRPLGGEPEPSMAEAIHDQNARDFDLEHTYAAAKGTGARTVFLVDVGWFFHLYPFAEGFQTVRVGYGEWFDGTRGQADRWARLIESQTDLTVIGHPEANAAFNQALRSTYADCTVFAVPNYVVIAGPSCPGRGGDLFANYERAARPS